MLTQRQTHLDKVLLSALAVLLLTTAVLADNLPTTATPPPSNSSLTTWFNNSGQEEPLVQRSFRPCGDNHVNYCKNGGQCIFPQDTDEPSCICSSSFSGERCLILTDHTRSPAKLEELIAISFGALMLFFALVIIIYCIVQKRCIHSKRLIKSAPSELSV